jgi:small redox-active disulfide protein 2
MKLQILGTGCPRCKALEANAKVAVSELKIDAEVEKVTDIESIAAMGVMMTPALAIDGTVKSAGRVLTKEQIISFMQGGK